MNQLLYQSERAEPPADCPPEQHAKRQQHADHIEAELKFHGAVHRLQRPDRTGKSCCRTRIAVQSRIAELFPFSLINLPALKIQ